MTILKLKPALKDYLWGGHRLVEEFNIPYDGEILAEAWELSCHPDGPSVITNGPYAGKTLREYLDAEGMEVLGTHCRRFREFPILTKFIDARDSLSIQVHPNNAFALKNENQYGKTEMWYVLDAEPGAYLYYGFKKEISKEEFRERIENNTLLEVLNPVEVQKGDVLFIESGTLHAIGKGLLIAEIQQNSNVTYRIYDYGRVGKDGKKRDLHIEKALAVTNRIPISRRGENYPHVADCDYFTVDKLDLDGKYSYRMMGAVNEESFLSILILDGEGTIFNRGEKVSYRKGDSIFLPAGSGEYSIEGKCDALITTIREKAAPIRVGIDIGSSEIKMGIVNDAQEIIARESYPFNRKLSARECIEELSEKILKLLEKHDIPLEQCIGVGVGIPGTIDRREGKVVYSNNIRWEDVPIVHELGKVIPCPVRIANNADCAALGEQLVGAGKDYTDVVMFVLGNGVGGGVILNNEVFEGGAIGGSEFGHMVVRTNGRLCTCGRKGCLEAYASVRALKESASRAAGREIDLKELFEKEKNGDIALQEVIEQYEEMLGNGVVNLVNLFRPQLVLIGGDISDYAERLLPSLEKMMREDSFGGAQTAIPEIAVARLGDNAGIIGAAML